MPASMRGRINLDQLRENLKRGRLTPRERKLVERVKIIEQMRADRYSWEEVGQKLGVSHTAVSAFAARSTFATISDFLREITPEEAAAAAVPAEVDAEAARAERAIEILRTTRTDLIGLTPTVVSYLARCLERDEKGDMKDDGKAMWATQMILKATGLSEPPANAGGGGAAPVVINIGSVHAEYRALDADDAEIARQARAIDITPTIVPAVRAALATREASSAGAGGAPA